MRFTKILGENSGFTLVELMVAVGIVGGLSAVAIPNYLKYVAKARQGEAKVSLSSVYVGEKQFAVEFGYYTSCLNRVGVNTPAGDRYYAFGFSNGQATAPKCGSAPSTSNCSTVPTTSTLTCTPGALGSATNDANNYNTVYGATLKAGTSFPVDADFGGATTNGVGVVAFSVGAVGNISSGATLDKWKIDNQKVLTNTNSGI